MSGHRQRVIPKRLWAEGEWYGPATDNPHDPRNDSLDEDDEICIATEMAKSHEQMFQARAKQRQEKR